MDLDQSRNFLREMQASWRQELTDDQVLVWADTLAPLDFEMARKAVRSLRQTSDWMPTHHQLIDATAKEARYARLALSARSDNERPKCSLCDGTGWAHAGVAGPAYAVLACRCSAGPADDGREHAPPCTCRRCFYGERRAEDIANGVDGLARSGPDTLRPYNHAGADA